MNHYESLESAISLVVLQKFQNSIQNTMTASLSILSSSTHMASLSSHSIVTCAADRALLYNL
jgi:hypothetical protein